MKVNYKGFEITAEREKALGGWDSTYFTVVRKSDDWFMIDSFTEATDPIKEIINDLKASVDEYLENPEEWEEDY